LFLRLQLAMTVRPLKDDIPVPADRHDTARHTPFRHVFRDKLIDACQPRGVHPDGRRFGVDKLGDGGSFKPSNIKGNETQKYR
jgi:hypothetical protein